jgi:hypothetical protein
MVYNFTPVFGLANMKKVSSNSIHCAEALAINTVDRNLLRETAN